MSKIYSEKHNARRAAKKALGKAFFEARILPCDNGWTFDEEAQPTQPTNAVDEAELGGMTQAEYEEEQDLAQEALDSEEQDTRPRHEQNGVDEALIYGPAAEWRQPAEGAPRGLKAAAQALLTAWDACPAEDTTENDISRAIRQLRTAMAGKTARAPRQHGTPREGTKQEAVLALLRRPQGATVAQIAEVTGWAAHTVRGFFAGLKKKGHEIQVLERVRMVGPNKAGAKGSYTVYHLPA